MFTGLKSVIFGMRDDGLLGDVLAPAMVLVRAMQETQIGSLGWEDSLEKGVATGSSILIWRIPWTEEPGGGRGRGGRGRCSKESDTTEQLILLLSVSFTLHLRTPRETFISGNAYKNQADQAFDFKLQFRPLVNWSRI